jgi:hypothetical protein
MNTEAKFNTMAITGSYLNHMKHAVCWILTLEQQLRASITSAQKDIQIYAYSLSLSLSTAPARQTNKTLPLLFNQHCAYQLTN